MHEWATRFEDWVSDHKAYFLVALFALALGIRLFYNFGFLDGTSSIGTRYLRSADSYSYYTAAHQIQHLQYYNFDRAPFFPLVIAIVQSIFGWDPLHLKIVLCLMGAFSCILIFLVGEMAFNTRVAIFASLVSAFYLPLIIINAMVLSESLYVLLTLLVLYFVFKLARDRRALYCVLCGVCMALAALTRSEFLFIIPLMLIALWIAKRKEHFGKYVVIMLVIVIVMIAPWSAFASSRNHTFVPISALGGMGFANANNPKMVSGEVEFHNKGFMVWYTSAWLLTEEDYKAMEGMTWGQTSDYLFKKSLQWLRHNPGEIPKLLMWKQFSFWFSPIQFTYPWLKYPKPSSMMVSYCIQYFFILIMFLFGAIKTFSLRKHYPLLVFLVGELIIASIWAANWRYIAFLQPIFLLYAGALLFGERVRRRKRSKYSEVPA